MGFLRSTENAVRVGILVALAWAGMLWAWGAFCAARHAAWVEKFDEKKEEYGVGFLGAGNPYDPDAMDAWNKDNPEPSLPLSFWPEGVKWWSVLMGAYVFLVVSVQLMGSTASKSSE